MKKQQRKEKPVEHPTKPSIMKGCRFSLLSIEYINNHNAGDAFSDCRTVSGSMFSVTNNAGKRRALLGVDYYAANANVRVFIHLLFMRLSK